MSGWVKLHRSLLDWEWYDDINVCRLFTHLILKANHKDKTWRGIKINTGSFVTGRQALSEETGLSEQKIRSCLDKLKSTSEITIESTNRYSVVTLVNWESYQNNDNELTSNSTTNPLSNQPTDNQQITTTKNDKNVNNKDKGKAKRFSPPTKSEAFSYFLERNHPAAEQEADSFIDFYSMKGWMIGKNKMKDWKAAIRNWMKNDFNKTKAKQPEDSSAWNNYI